VENVPAAGGPSLRDKWQILRLIPRYLRAMWIALAGADAVHVRCPANISLIAIVYLALRRQPTVRWVKYAGNWQPENPDPLSYRFQRWWLRRGWQGGVVTVNGRWPNQASHIHPFHNPSLTQAEQEAAGQAGIGKILSTPLRLLFIGTLSSAKGVPQVLQIVRQLHQQNIPFTLHLLGDGPERQTFEAESRRIGLAATIHFHGWLPKDALAAYYAQAHFLLLPSQSEGWPKVLSEALAYGVVPLASNISSISQILAEIGSGKTHPVHDVAAFTQSICNYLQSPDRWQQESQAGRQAVYRFTYEAYLQAVTDLLAQME
jgi:glycosyltransferase involved in cell wall biosynthesis